jgi:hypothetical protein
VLAVAVCGAALGGLMLVEARPEARIEIPAWTSFAPIVVDLEDFGVGDDAAEQAVERESSLTKPADVAGASKSPEARPAKR